MRRLGSIILLSLALATPAWGFSTLDGDRTRWMINPSFSIGQTANGIADGSDSVAIRAAFQSWQDVQGSTIQFREVPRNGDITLDFEQNWPREFGEFTAGITLTQRGRGRISHATVQFNDQNFEWATDGSFGLTDVEGVAAHEIGHAIGLGHSFYRAASMYWTGNEVDLAELDPDDIRGVHYLYGEGGEGDVCDTCLADADCADGPCLNLEPGRSFCGKRCAAGCPENTDCFELNDGSTTCAPVALVCSDSGMGEFAEGSYCFGAEQCPGELECIPTADSAACIAPGSLNFGDECVSSLECSSELCLPLDDALNVCSAECDPENAACPGGAPCVAIDEPGADLDGLCVPPGDVAEGGACGDAARRCANDLTCIVTAEGADGTCRAACDPFGMCPQGRGCTPFGPDDWFCLAAEGPGEGSDCVEGQCAGGLLCLPLGDDEPGLCTRPCDPEDNQCGGEQVCFELLEGLGVCPTRDTAFGEDCESPLDCTSFVCVARPEGSGVCSRACGGVDGCPDGWLCGRTNSGAVCFIDETPPDMGHPDVGRPDVGTLDAGPDMSMGDTGGKIDMAADDADIQDVGLTQDAGGQGGAGGQGQPSSDGGVVIRRVGSSEDDGCATSTSSSPFGASLLVFLAGLFRRRRTG